MSSDAALVLRVQNLEQRVDHWDAQFGRLLSVSGESRDAAVRAADQALELMGQIRDLKTAVETRCDERCGTLKHDVKLIRESLHEQQQNDEFDLTTGVMDRDQLINSRQSMKYELQELKKQLGLLSKAEDLRAQAERKRDQAERDKRVAEQAVRDAETARVQVQRDAEQNQREADERDQQKDEQLKKEKVKSMTSIVLAILGIVSAAVTAAIAHWG